MNVSQCHTATTMCIYIILIGINVVQESESLGRGYLQMQNNAITKNITINAFPRTNNTIDRTSGLYVLMRSV